MPKNGGRGTSSSSGGWHKPGKTGLHKTAKQLVKGMPKKTGLHKMAKKTAKVLKLKQKSKTATKNKAKGPKGKAAAKAKAQATVQDTWSIIGYSDKGWAIARWTYPDGRREVWQRIS